MQRKRQPRKTLSACVKDYAYGIWERTGGNKAAKKRFAAKNTWLNILDSESSFVIHKL